MMPKLLLADDSITVQRVIALTFQGEGIEVIAVGDGDQAVDAIDRERPQIVLADLSMPGRDGYAVAEYVKRSPELSKDIRVVLLTGAAEPVEEARSRALGIDGVLSKPFEPHVATALVRRLLTETPMVPSFREAAFEGAGAPDARAAEPLKAAAPPPLPGAAAAAGGPGSAAAGPGADNTIAVDDYFRRLDEALATAGLSTAPDTAGDLAAIAGQPGLAADRSGDAETIIMPRPAPVAADAPAADAAASGSDETDETDEAPKLVDAFSALLAAEEGDGGPMVAGPVEMDGAPAPVPAPAVEWTSGHAAAAPVEAAAETVAMQAVVAEATAAPPPIEESAAPVPNEAAEVIAPDMAVAGEEPVADHEPVAEDEPVAAIELPPAAPAAPAAVAALVERGPVATGSAPSGPPAALRADAANHAALDGIDLDVFADAVAQKILHRLTDARIDAIVSERVLEIAERLVREEIDRIKADAQ
jgi:CheY-like chemotaxis protein